MSVFCVRASCVILLLLFVVFIAVDCIFVTFLNFYIVIVLTCFYYSLVSASHSVHIFTFFMSVSCVFFIYSF